MDEMMKADGITHLDRLPQDKLKEVMETCGIWSYPTHFGEISCISAMKAQCYGAIPVVVNYAALQTTVQYGVKVDGDIYDKETQEEYKKQLIALLKDDNRQEEIREPMIKWAKDTFSWSKVASDWTKEFHGN
jgi:glycosyltransferase involved in cell wall biosynthesis